MKPEDRPKKINLHSANPYGVTKMSQLLFDAGIDHTVNESMQLFDLGENE